MSLISSRYADQLLIGDEVLVQRNYELTPVEVINIFNITTQGNYSCNVLSIIDCLKYDRSFV